MAFAELKLQIVVTLAGKSSRFKEQGITVAKPLLPIAERPMVSYALESVEPLLALSQLIGVVCAEDKICSEVQKIFKTFSDSSVILEIPKRTAGPVQTVLAAANVLDMEAPLLILDGDIYFKAPSFLNRLIAEEAFTALPGGNLLCFESNNPAFSYIREGIQGRVIQIAEKKVISKSAVLGAYHFRSAGDFVRAAIPLVFHAPLREHYISQVIGIMLEDGAEFYKTQCDFHLSFGTPEELAQSERDLRRIKP